MDFMSFSMRSNVSWTWESQFEKKELVLENFINHISYKAYAMLQ